jgi:mycothiol system anti-sigma-R factor
MGSPEVGCGHVLAHVWQYLDQEVDRALCSQVEAHLAGCEQCRQAVEFDRSFKQVVRRCGGTESIPHERLEALIVRVRQRIRFSPPPD